MEILQTLRNLTLLVCLTACSSSASEPDDDSPSGTCTEGQQISCPCGGGQVDGVQVCTSAGTYGQCQCSGFLATGGNAGVGGTYDPSSGGSSSGGSSTGGSSSTGGNDPGAGGTTMGTGGGAPGSCSSPVTDMICDMEESTGPEPMLIEYDSRKGPWFTSADTDNDSTIVAAASLDTDVDPVRCTSTRAVHATGTAKGWGSVAGFHFNSKAAVITAYDASAYAGVAFFAKGAGTLRMELMSNALDPDAGCSGDQCSGYHGTDVVLSSDWQLVQIPFATLVQPTWSSDVLEVDLDLSETRGIQFKVESGAVNFWIDDIGFY